MTFSAIDPGIDLSAHARALARTREAVMAGSRPAARPRSLVSRSWSRTLGHGLDPDGPNPRQVFLPADYEQRRRNSVLRQVVEEFRTVVGTYADAAHCILVVTDADGVILWRHGSARVLLRADQLGFGEGALWTERAVGTNAIGTAIAEAAPVQLFAAEHFEQGQVPWYCTAAPIHDPRTGEMVGVVDISGPALALHPMVAALVDSMVRLAEHGLRTRHRDNLERLRSRAAAKWSLVDGPALLVDRDGWVAQSVGVRPRERVAVPQEGELMAVPGLGVCLPETLAGGWLLRPPAEDGALRLCLDLSARAPALVATGAAEWRTELTNRHAEILLLLHRATPAGLSAADLSRALYGDPDHLVTVRAEVSRLRRTVGDVVVRRPYRLAADVEMTVRTPPGQDVRDTLLVRSSSAPGVRALRGGGVPAG